MSRVDMSVLDTDFYKTRVKAKLNGSLLDPTGGTVEFAFKTTRDGNPTSGDWHFGSWETDNGEYYAIIEVGPLGAVTLVENTYRVWVRINGRPVKTPGSLCIF